MFICGNGYTNIIHPAINTFVMNAIPKYNSQYYKMLIYRLSIFVQFKIKESNYIYA